MSLISYDLHLHSCLSPCADNDMTVNNIVNMARLKELDLIALTDHNSCKNCPAFLQAAKRAGQRALPGMELCTSEEIHVVFLFSSLAGAMAFDSYVSERMPQIQNDEQAFGHQWILDGEDRVVSSEPILLLNAAGISIDDTPALARKFGALCFPAHIDRDSYSILSALGFLPPELVFGFVELADPANLERVKAFADLTGKSVLTSSDAHYLWQISEPEHFVEEEKLGFLLSKGENEK